MPVWRRLQLNHLFRQIFAEGLEEEGEPFRWLSRVSVEVLVVDTIRLDGQQKKVPFFPMVGNSVDSGPTFAVEDVNDHTALVTVLSRMSVNVLDEHGYVREGGIALLSMKIEFGAGVAVLLPWQVLAPNEDRSCFSSLAQAAKVLDIRVVESPGALSISLQCGPPSRLFSGLLPQQLQGLQNR